MIEENGGKCSAKVTHATTHLVATKKDWDSKSAKGRGLEETCLNFPCTISRKFALTFYCHGVQFVSLCLWRLSRSCKMGCVVLSIRCSELQDISIVLHSCRIY